MLWAVWIALAVGLVWVALALFRAVRQALECLRSVRHLQKAVLDRAGELAKAAERLAAHGEPATRLGPALARLRGSQARLAVLQGAVDEVTDSFGRVSAFFPRK